MNGHEQQGELQLTQPSLRNILQYSQSKLHKLVKAFSCSSITETTNGRPAMNLYQITRPTHRHYARQILPIILPIPPPEKINPRTRTNNHTVKGSFGCLFDGCALAPQYRTGSKRPPTQELSRTQYTIVHTHILFTLKTHAQALLMLETA